MERAQAADPTSGAARGPSRRSPRRVSQGYGRATSNFGAIRTALLPGDCRATAPGRRSFPTRGMVVPDTGEKNISLAESPETLENEHDSAVPTAQAPDHAAAVLGSDARAPGRRSQGRVTPVVTRRGYAPTRRRRIEVPGPGVDASGNRVEIPGRGGDGSGRAVEVLGRRGEIPGQRVDVPGRGVAAPSLVQRPSGARSRAAVRAAATSGCAAGTSAAGATTSDRARGAPSAPPGRSDAWSAPPEARR